VEHEPVWSLGGVLISLSVAMSPYVDKTLKSVPHGQCDARLSYLSGRRASPFWPVPNCTCLTVQLIKDSFVWDYGTTALCDITSCKLAL